VRGWRKEPPTRLLSGKHGVPQARLIAFSLKHPGIVQTQRQADSGNPEPVDIRPEMLVYSQLSGSVSWFKVFDGGYLNLSSQFNACCEDDCV